jgi:maleylpyruvate isomerase
MTIDPRSPDFDPSDLLAQLAEATAGLVATAQDLDDDAMHAPSSLPGWTRGHVLTHLARNADGLSNLLAWAVTGERREMYPSREHRNADIEAGAPRPAAEITNDLKAASERFAQEAAKLTPDHWRTQIERRPNQPYSAAHVPWWRYEEVLIHHVDLDAGYSPAHWPADFSGTRLDMTVEWFNSPLNDAAVQAFRIYTEDTARMLGVRCDPTLKDPLLVRGPERALLAWLVGRESGDDLVVEPFDALPVLSAWM